MNKQPFFSVIVPAYNCAEWIRTGLESIRAQTFTDYELIVVCDSCTDNTEEIAREYADKVFTVQHDEPGLNGLTLNIGLDHAEGKYILFMDDDDHFHGKLAFRRIHDVILQKDHPDALLLAVLWKGRGYVCQRHERLVTYWSKCYKREFIGDLRFTDTKYISDGEFNRDLFEEQFNPNLSDKQIEYMSMPTYYYNYMRTGSFSWKLKKGEIQC